MKKIHVDRNCDFFAALFKYKSVWLSCFQKFRFNGAFLNEAFLAWCESPRNSGEGLIDRKLRKFLTNVKINKGSRTVAKKITIESLPPDRTIIELRELLKAFTGQIDPQRLLEELSNTGKVTGRAKAKTQITFDSDAVDAFLAARFVQLLDETVARIGKYDDLKMYQTRPRVARYFDEDVFSLAWTSPAQSSAAPFSKLP